MNTKQFFNVEGVAHASFLESDPVWEALSRLNEYLHSLELGNRKGEISDQAYLVHPELITIGEGSRIEPGAYVEGPCVIGRNCVIRHGSYIRSGVLIGDDCVIGHASEIKHSILLDGAKAAHFAYVGDSILGRNVNLGAGVRCANFRLDGQPIVIHASEGVIETGLRKLGAIIGDESALGCNCVTNPGTLLMPKSRCYPCSIVSGRPLTECVS